ncbi:Histidine kinase-%2C DNA gyrase B-%2C and HSP90-like ATPase [Legionella pneumophila]|uniref:ATP-binding protein n=1 Tax=Legionella pneumophila TaxID=446 RepID=UPI0007707732|nr:ATP-binding protein [Legionella pneumophila]CZP46164.1 Histidine kinase-%2C DNA gyrase B-%2C and HSP90-like ATPase [Legionella pneumophila]
MQLTSEGGIKNWLTELSKINDNDCRSPGFWKPYHLVTTGLTMKRVGAKNFTLPEEFQSYAARMKLWDSIDIDPPLIVNSRNTNGRFLPVHSFNRSYRDVISVGNKLAEVVIQTASLEYQDTINICLQELVNNFFDHANAEDNFPCLVAAQSWPKGGIVQVAIADSGIGIRNSLSKDDSLVEELKKGNACEISSRYGVSSKLNNGHSGYGLTLAKDLMKQANGRFILVSGNEIFIASGDDEKALISTNPWTGTLLVLEWKMNVSLNSINVYNNWPNVEGFNADDFF